MVYNILILEGENSPLRSARAEMEKVGAEFLFETISSNSPTDEIIDKARRSHAILYDGSAQSAQLHALATALNLHTEIRSTKNSAVVNDFLSGIYYKDKGFRTNGTFGREAYDTECYSELEIERTARVAYELQGINGITLIDKADALATSKLWRKIVTDINEDYPCVRVDTLTTDVALREIAYGRIAGTLLAPRLFADMIFSLIKEKDGEKFSALLGDTALGAYGITKESDAPLAVKFLLCHSFDIK